MNEIFEAYQSVFIPAIVGGGALIAWMSLRNESISKRVRDLKQESLKKDGEVSQERRENISDQIKLFKERYEKNNKSLTMAIGAFKLFICFVSISVFIKILNFSLSSTSGCISQFIYISPLIILIIGFGILVAALCRMVDEVTSGKETLFKDLDFKPPKNDQRENASDN